ncbi:MAG: hypothetical protein JWP25_7715 [Bradyrhizobium sp.]|nr:hypothetical protein [Bradyrhizobium sp.]
MLTALDRLLEKTTLPLEQVSRLSDATNSHSVNWGQRIVMIHSVRLSLRRLRKSARLVSRTVRRFAVWPSWALAPVAAARLIVPCQPVSTAIKLALDSESRQVRHYYRAYFIGSDGHVSTSNARMTTRRRNTL